MRRRRFLAALSGTVGSGWCVLSDTQADAAASTTTGDAVGWDGSDGVGGSDRDVVAQRTADRTLALSPSSYVTDDRGTVELQFAAPATADGPAVLRATLTNANDFENTFRLGETPPFDRTPQAKPETTADRLPVFLAPTANHDLCETPPAYGRADDGRWLLAREDDWLPETVTLGPGETVRGEYVLLGHPESRKPPLGRYEIAPEFALGLTAWRTTKQGPRGRSAFEGTEPPSLPVEEERPVNWYHDADRESAVYLEPSAEYVSLPAELEFTFHNHSRRPRSCEFYRLYRWEGDGWRLLDRGYPVQACYGRSPGERTTFRLRAFPGKVLEGDGGLRSRSMRLDPGRYAFAVGYDEVYAALFELVGQMCGIPLAERGQSRSRFL
ncbi:hypothetical protein [Halorussus sp. MSC15.2]|uniref:hypothetical protein n=1 Tax=Halorussus sp. MSC15.2 TaxID=2283638 RepID=UPI0013D42A39|nr:hypothetical protein [Halorussus sp. MSC15.2]NEU58801.1 hypothetical protein [Halorussus sp. MSC15.2]